MSIYGSLGATFHAGAPAARPATIPDSLQHSGRGNGGDPFMSLVSTTEKVIGQDSIRSSISPQIAYQASLLGSFLDEAPPVVGGGDSVEGGGDLAPLSLELVAGASNDGAAGEPDEEAQMSNDQSNDLPVAGDGDVYSPIGRAEGDEPPADEVTNALPRAVV